MPSSSCFSGLRLDCHVENNSSQKQVKRIIDDAYSIQLTLYADSLVHFESKLHGHQWGCVVLVGSFAVVRKVHWIKCGAWIEIHC